MLKGIGSHVVVASKSGEKGTRVLANIGTPQGNAPQQTTRAGAGASGGIYERGVLDGFINDDDATIRRIARNIYQYDPVSGTVIDILATTPFSPFELTALPDQKMLNIYAENIDAMDTTSLSPEIARQHMVDGAYIGQINENTDLDIFTGIVPIDIDACNFTYLPFANRDPVIDVTLSQSVKNLIKSKDPRIADEFAKYGSSLTQMATKGTFPLDPRTTIFFPHRTLATFPNGTSYLKRIIPVWLYEKALLKGTIDLAHRRQKSILHLMVGDEEYLPTEAQLGQYAKMFADADADPTGAVIATRPQVQTNEIRCLSGNTLIHTSKGLIRIDKLVIGDIDDLEEKTTVPIDTMVKSIDGGWVKADKWHYQGIKPTNRYYTESNAKLNCTENHKVLALKLGGELDLVKIKDISDDYICIDTKGTQADKELLLCVDKPEIFARKDNTFIEYPEYMTEALAYIMGMIVSEGYMNKGSIQVANTDMELLQKYSDACFTVFNKKPNINHKRDAGIHFIQTKEYKTKKCYSADISSQGIVQYLEQLGVCRSVRQTKSPAYYKQIPWSILQADSKSKYAFLAAYIDADGTITNKSNGTNNAVEIKFFSRSNDILNSIKTMLQDLGYHSVADYKYHRVYLNTSNASRLYNKILPYLGSRKKCVDVCDEPKTHKFGIPSDIFVPIINERFVRRQGYSKTAEAGSIFLNDKDEEILLSGIGETFRHYKSAKSMFLYSEYKKGKYAKELFYIKQISQKMYDNLIRLFELELKFEKIIRVKQGRTQPTYDISIKKGYAPIFVANGMLVKNSGADFWKIDETNEFLTQQKMRGLGVSDSLLSGDLTVDGTTQVMTIFLDKMRGFREAFTRKVYYQKVLLNIAIKHGFERKKEQESVTGADIDENHLRNLYSKNDADYIISYLRETRTIEGLNHVMIADNQSYRLSDYHLPKIQYHKALKPEGNSELMTNLQTLQGQGLNIPLRIWAVAAGISIPELMRMMPEDIKLRQQMQTFKQQWPQDPTAQANQLLQSQLIEAGLAPKTLKPLNRKMPDLRVKDPDTHKILSAKGAAYMNEKRNRVIAEAVSRINMRHNHQVKLERKVNKRFHYRDVA